MDSALKEIMKEEKRRREKSHKKHKERRSRSEPKKNRHRERSRSRNRDRSRSRSKNFEKSISISVENINNIDDGIERFMFVYEDKNGTLYSKLESVIIEKEGDEVKIFPVYVTGYNDNLSEETIIFKGGNFTSSVENSWLPIIQSKEENISILEYEMEDIIVYNGKFFHCLNDLYEYIETHGAEYLPIKK